LQADGACLIRLELFEPNERHVGVLFLIKWKTQVCTLVCENTELIALGKALTACSDRRVQRTRRVRRQPQRRPNQRIRLRKPYAEAAGEGPGPSA
jgi:hypothetical protein